jgi:hypothetical protein
LSPPRWDEAGWPWQVGTVRLLPVLHGRLECARAVRAHLDAFDPERVVLELPRALADPWGRAVAQLPRLRAIRIEDAGRVLWLIPEPCDPAVEATRWATERGREWLSGDLAVPRYGEHRDLLPDVAALPEIGYRAFVQRVLARAVFRRDPADDARERTLAATAARAAEGGRRVAVVLGLAHVAGVAASLARGAPAALARPAAPIAGVLPLDPESLAEVLLEPPFVQRAWERARAGDEPAVFAPPGRSRAAGALLHFPGSEQVSAAETAASGAGAAPQEDAECADERAAAARGEDLLARPRLFYRLVQQAARQTRERGGSEPSPGERRVLHTFARNLALLEGRLCPDLYEIVVAARGAVDDRFARDLLELGSAWPWAGESAGGVRLSAQELGRSARLLTLRPRIDRLARRPSLRDALREAAEGNEGSGICSHPPEDQVVEALGADLRERGAARAARAGLQIVPFVASLLDGLDARETLRRRLTDGRPCVREEVASHGQVGAVVVAWEDEAIVAGRSTRFPWAASWHGEHQNESDMAFFATDPEPGEVAPGIHRAEYGGFMLTWPPLRLGDVWRDPAYRFCRSKAELLLVAALDYSEQPLVVFVAPRAPRPEIGALARRLGRRIVHLRPGVLSPDRLRRLRSFHVLAGKHLRPLAQWVVPPP